MTEFINNIPPNRSVVDLNVKYQTGIDRHGNPIMDNEKLTLIVPNLASHEIRDYLENYCSRKNMQLIHWNVDGVLNGTSPFEFTCENCSETSADMSPASERRFCSNFCERTRKHF